MTISIVRGMGKWTAGAIGLGALTLMALNAAGGMVTVLGDRNTLQCHAGMVVVYLSGEGIEYDAAARRPRVRWEWNEPVWRTGSWGWQPSVRRGFAPYDVITPTGVFAVSVRSPEIGVWQVPLWMAAVPALAVSVPLAVRDWRRARRRRNGACVRCGYDLRGQDGRTKCPECGVDAAGLI